MVLDLPQALTQKEATTCLRDFARAWREQAGTDLVVNAAALARFDSSALAVMLELRRLALAQGQRFSVRKLPAQLAKLSALYGIEDLLPAEAASSEA
jgi:phospholipid transport system transporter-binding protein